MVDTFEFNEDTLQRYDAYEAKILQHGTMRYHGRDTFPNGLTLNRPEMFRPVAGFWMNNLNQVAVRVKTQNILAFGAAITLKIEILSVDREGDGDYDNEIEFRFTEPDEWQIWKPVHNLLTPKAGTYPPLFTVHNPLVDDIEIEWGVDYENITARYDYRKAITLDELRMSYPGFHL
jgi:hypothetical protein